MRMGFKMRIYPNKEQEELLFEYCKVSHDMWNYLVAKHKNEFPRVSKLGILDYNPTQLMNEMGVKIPQRIALWVCKKYADAVIRVYKKFSKQVKFHKYNPNKQSFCITSKKYIIKGYRIPFLLCLGQQVKNVMSRKILLDKEYINKYNITEIIEPFYIRYKGIWYLAGSYNIPDIKKDNSKSVLGLDWGIKNFMTTSESELINYPPSVLREYQRIKRLQSIKDKKKKGSKNREKILLKLQKAYIRFENLKKDFIEKETTKLAKKYHISVEKTSNLDRFIFIRRNRMIAPKQTFLHKLEFKCNKYGSYYTEVDSHYTSKICSECGQIHDIKLKDRVVICDCGLVLDRDINAAINIKKRGEEILSQVCTCHTQLSL